MSETAHEEEVVGTSNGDVGSLLDVVAKQVNENRTRDYHKDLPIPGTGGMLVARFRPYPVSKSERSSRSLRQRVENNEPVILDVACQTLIDACEQIMVRKSQDAEPIPVDDEVPVKFDERLADLLRLSPPGTPPLKRARDVVKALFPTEQAVLALATEVDGWLRDVTKEADQEALGE